MRRTIVGLTALLVSCAVFSSEDAEAGRRRRCCDPCSRKNCCAPQPTCCAPCATCCAPALVCCAERNCSETTIDCPQKFLMATIGMMPVHYTYSCNECDCTGSSCGQDTQSPYHTYSRDLKPTQQDPNEMCTDFTCSGSSWVSGSGPDCVFESGPPGPGPMMLRTPKTWHVPNHHSGKHGLDQYCDPSAAGFRQIFRNGYSGRTTNQSAFNKGGTPRYCYKTVVLDNNNQGRPVVAIAYEQDGNVAGTPNVAATAQPDAANAPYWYTTVVTEPDANGRLFNIRLHVYTKN